MLSRKDGSSDGTLARTLLGGSIGRYAKYSLDSATIERRSSSKFCRLKSFYQTKYVKGNIKETSI